MSDKPATKKIDKEFLLTDSSVNVYGFRLLTEGYLIDEFKKNPIGYYMHLRDDGVVVRWEDIRIDGDKVYGKPVVNLSNDRGKQTVDEIENSFLNGASVGHIMALEWSDDPSNMLPGQSGPTITKWYNRECSIVDVPGNMNSLALFDKQGNLINLADFSKPQNLNMKQIILTASQLTLLNLKADSDSAAVETQLNDLVAKAAKVEDLQAKLIVAQTEKQTAVDALDAFKKGANTSKINDLVAAALTEKKITVELGETLKADYAGNPEGLEKMLKAMPKYQPITEQLKGDTGAALASLSWTELDKQNKLEDLKAKNIEAFKEKFKEHFGKEYSEK